MRSIFTHMLIHSYPVNPISTISLRHYVWKGVDTETKEKVIEEAYAAIAAKVAFGDYGTSSIILDTAVNEGHAVSVMKTILTDPKFQTLCSKSREGGGGGSGPRSPRSPRPVLTHSGGGGAGAPST